MNKDDTTGAVAARADAIAIVDEFAPFVWHGTGACATWMKDYDADAARRGITDGAVTLGTPLHVDVDGNRAYLVTDLRLQDQGEGRQGDGIALQFAMLKGPNDGASSAGRGRRITAQGDGPTRWLIRFAV